MAEAVVSTILEQLASILRQQVEEEVRLVVGVEEEVRKLTSNFQAIQCVLEDAERKQVTEKAVGDWLEDLTEVSCNMEDVLDEWNTTIQKRRIMEADENVSKLVRMVRSLITCFGFCSRQVVTRRDIALKIKDLDKTLEDIAVKRDRFSFSLNQSSKEVERLITSSVVDTTKIHGRDHVKKEIKNLLLSESSEGLTSLPIISIVGMGGIGKTTLARLVFNDDEVKACFDKTIWVCVSEPVEKIRIAKAILESLKNGKLDVDEYETLLQNIKELIKEKKVLLVLDDVWNGESEKWEELIDSLKHGSSQSRILVTTRNENVANLMGSHHMIPLEILSDQGSWSLFNQVAFTTNEECQKFEKIGREIVKKCKGLPLAIKTLGSLLRFKKTIEEWQSVLDSELWESKDVEKWIFAPLLLSYFDLPSEIKRCFLYCAIFPKDLEIEKDELIKLWMAQGYLKSERTIDWELVGEEYFETLAMRSFFQDFERDDDESIISCNMHDLVHDLAQYLTKNEFYSAKVDDVEGFLLSSKYRRARHAMIMLDGEASFPISIFDKRRLHSLLLGSGNWSLDELFDHHTSVRVLYLIDMSINDVPSGINKLIHLRYLNISNNDDMKEIPEAICELYNLQTLDISSCANLNKLPEGIGKLVNLRHLINYESFDECRYMPQAIKRLTSLRTLSNIVVSGDKKACKFECLRNINQLGGLLSIKCCEVNMGEINEAELQNKTKLNRLDLKLSSDVSNEEALEDFQPPSNLAELRLKRYGGDIRSSLNWLMSLTKLKRLVLNSWSGSGSLCLGKLPCLESLKIEWMKSLKRLGDEFLGIGSDNMTSPSSSSSVALFPKLQSLYFFGLEEWEEWDGGSCGREGEDIKIMPSLSSLSIFGCRKLKTLPHYLLQLTTLEAFDIYSCPILQSRYRVDEAKNWVRGSGIPKLRIYQNSETSSPSVTSDSDKYSLGEGDAEQVLE